MGEIREELVLVDQFSASFSRFIAQGEAAAGKMGQLDQVIREAGMSSTELLLHGMGRVNQSVSAVNDSVREMGELSRYVAVQGMNEINQTLKQVVASTDRMSSAQREYSQQVNQSTDSANRLLSGAGRIAAALGGIKLASGLVGL